MTSDDLDTLLRRHGQTWQDEFTPPPLAPMLESAIAPSRTRRWLPALVAAVLLSIPIGTVVAVHHNRTATPAAPQAFTIPDTITENGQTLQRSTDLSWNDAVISTDGRQITVQVTVDDVACQAPTIRGFVTADGAQSVTLSVTTYVYIGASLQCIRLAPGGHAVPIIMKSALGSRQLIDHFDGKTHVALRSTAMPELTFLPAGYGSRLATALAWNEQGRTATRSYSVLAYKGLAKAPTLTVSRTSPRPNQFYPGAGNRPNVLGNPAKILIGGDPSEMQCVDWEDSRYFWTVCSSARLSEAELLKIANSLR